jgi:predicted Rdx family selenoprotein
MATTNTVTVKITPNDNGNPAGTLADAELHFFGGPLDGLKMIGFSIWERRGDPGVPQESSVAVCIRDLRTVRRKDRTHFADRSDVS